MWLDKNQRGAGKPKDSRFISSNNNGGNGELGKNYAAVVSRRQMAPLGSPFSGGLDTFVLMSAPIQSSGQPLLTNHNPFTTTDKIYIILATKISSYRFCLSRNTNNMAYFKPSYGVNGLGIPMGPMDAATLHHSMGYSGTLTL